MDDAGFQAHDHPMETVNDTPPPAEAPPYRQPGHRLTRSTDDKVVGGLSGGLGRWFGIDPIVFRIAFVVLTLAGGSGVLLYLIGWLLIPDDAGGTALHRFGNERHSKLIAAVLAGLGLLILLDNIGGGDDDIPFGLVLVGIGALFLWTRRKSAEGGPPAPPAPPAPPSAPTDDLSATPAPSEPETATFSAPATLVDLPPAPPAPAAREPKPRSALVAVTLSLLAILAGGLALVGVSLTTGLALALLLTSGALVLGAWRGRARGLIPVGLLLTMALGVASVVDDVPLRGGTGEVSFRPAALEEIRTPYRLSAGELVVDLSDLDLRGQSVTIVASVAAGNLQLIVPRDVAVDVDAHVGAGDIQAFGRLSEGFDIDRSFSQPGREGAGRLVVRAQVGLGQMEVRRAAA